MFNGHRSSKCSFTTPRVEVYVSDSILGAVGLYECGDP